MNDSQYLLSLFIFSVFLSTTTNCVSENHKSTNRSNSKTHHFRHRCRTTDDLGRIPWLLSNSTFYNFGYPLIRTWCELRAKGSDNRSDVELKKETTLLGCQSIKLRQYDWLNCSHMNTRAGYTSSTILIDPPLTDDGGASAGVFTINALFPILFDLGYKVRIRNWSPIYNSSYPKHIVVAAMSDTLKWKSYAASLKMNQMQNPPNPFADIDDYISLQVEVGNNLYQEPPAEIIGSKSPSSEFPRILRWVIGYQKRVTNPVYDVLSSSSISHCIGANFFLGEGFRCSSSSVIMCPMFPLHQKASQKLPKSKEARYAMKQNIVLIDGDSKDVTIEYLRDSIRAKGLKNVKVMLHEGRQRWEVPDLYKIVKVTLDCRNPGIEFINYESTLYDVINLVCDSRATRSIFDFPVPSRYRYEPNMLSETVDLVYEMIVNYTQHIDDFKYFKELSRKSETLVPKHLDLHLFSRDILFRTHCRTYSECRRVFPWALSVWALFPLVRIEVYIEIDVGQFELDNDAILDVLSHTFISMFWKVFVWNHVETKGDRLSIPAVIPPIVSCTHVMYMSPKLILFGRDFLNEHIAAIEGDKTHRPIVYYSENGELISAFTKVFHRRAVVYHWSEKSSNNRKWTYKAHMIIDGKRYEIDDVALSSMGYNSLEGTKNFKRADVEKIPSGLPDGLKLTYNSSDPFMSLASLPLEKFTHPALPLDFLYIEKTAKHKSCQIWISSTSKPMKCSTLLNRYRSDDMLVTIVRHLDPIIQSSYFQKVMRLLPTDMQRVLFGFDAALYPEVISLLDSKSQSWGEECR